MDKNQIEDYLKQLKDIENNLSSEEAFDADFAKKIDDVLNTLSEDISNIGESFQSFTTQTNDDLTPKQNGVVTSGVLVKVKKLVLEAVVPSYSKVGDAGMDLTITDIKENTSFSITYGFGIAMEIPKGFVGLIFPRSSVRNQDLILSNCVGVIDSGYRGELQATFKKTQGLDSISYNIGERGAQIIVLPYPTIYMTEVPELSDTERGTGGFGSTGK
jgi:dUTP pyrophosphatase